MRSVELVHGRQNKIKNINRLTKRDFQLNPYAQKCQYLFAVNTNDFRNIESSKSSVENVRDFLSSSTSELTHKVIRKIINVSLLYI